MTQKQGITKQITEVLNRILQSNNGAEKLWLEHRELNPLYQELGRVVFEENEEKVDACYS